MRSAEELYNALVRDRTLDPGPTGREVRIEMIRAAQVEAAEEMRERAARLLQSDNHLIARAIRALPVEAWREEPSS